MDSVHALLIRTEGNSKLAQKWIITDEATVAPDIKRCAVHTYVIPLYSYSKCPNFHVYYNAIALCILLATYISIPLKP